MGRYRFFSSVPVLVLKPRFLQFNGSGSGTSVLMPWLKYKVFSGGGFHFSHFVISLVPFRLQFRWNLKPWHWNLNRLET